MNLTAEQLQAVASGQVLRLNVENTEIVILRADLYDGVGAISPADDEEDVRKYYPLVNEAMREDDQHDPLLESYQEAYAILSRCDKTGRTDLAERHNEHPP